MCREPPPGHVFTGSLAEIDPKVAKVVRGSREKNNASATHFFALSPKPIARFRCKRARVRIFRPQPHLPSFIQIHPSFRDLLAKTFQIVTIYGDPIADNKRMRLVFQNAVALKALPSVNIRRRFDCCVITMPPSSTKRYNLTKLPILRPTLSIHVVR